MEKNQRFNPQRLGEQAVLLQKEIYRKEERAMAMSGSPEKRQYEQFVMKLRPNIAGNVDGQEELTNRAAENKSVLVDGVHNRVGSDFKASSRSHNALLDPNEKTLERLYRARIGAAVQYKDRYDFNNRSPITWLAKQENLADSSTHRKNPSPLMSQNVSKLFQQLNSKKILKGMGYAKSNIFIS